MTPIDIPATFGVSRQLKDKPSSNQYTLLRLSLTLSKLVVCQLWLLLVHLVHPIHHYPPSVYRVLQNIWPKLLNSYTILRHSTQGDLPSPNSLSRLNLFSGTNENSYMDFNDALLTLSACCLYGIFP